MNRAQRRRAQRAGQTDVPKPHAAVVYVHHGSIRASFAYCLLRMFLHELGRTGLPPALIQMRFGSGQLVAARNGAVEKFLELGIEWALLVDADMGFDGSLLADLLATADPEDRPIMGALCFAQKRAGNDDPLLQAVKLKCEPTIYDWAETDDEVGFLPRLDYERDRVVQASATGAACVLVHRNVFVTMRERYGDNWFTQVRHPKGDTEFSEDMSFFIRAQACGFPVHVNTAVKTSHDKGGLSITEETFDDQLALNALKRKLREEKAAS